VEIPEVKGGLSPTVHEGGSLFGFGGQYLVCLDAATGEPRWREKTNAGTLIRVGTHLVVLGELSGILRVAEAGPAAYRELARATAFNAGAQSSTGPSYADGRIFVRNVEEMVAYELGVDRSAAAGVKPRGIALVLLSSLLAARRRRPVRTPRHSGSGRSATAARPPRRSSPPPGRCA
jgi:hypothetical protein